MKTSKINLIKSIMVIPVLTMLVGIVLLLAVAFLPSDAMLDNVTVSAQSLVKEALQQSYSPASRRVWYQDTYTDALIIESSYTMENESIDNVLLNRVVPGTGRPARLLELAYGEAQATQSYSRYWMGFRIFVRLLLLFMNYYELRAFAGLVVFSLLAIVIASTSKCRGIFPALAIPIAFLAMEPWAVCSSLQYSCCFILTYLMICLLNFAEIQLDDKVAVKLFCLFGALTQFFDFYTYPIIVFAIPCLVLLSDYKGDKPIRRVLVLLLAWLLSWVFMWLLKLVITCVLFGGSELFTTMKSVASRFGVGEYKTEQYSYSIKEAFYKVWYYNCKIPLKLAVSGTALLVIVLMIFSKWRFGTNPRLFSYLLIAALPLVWIAATPQPINIHYMFQYRSTYALLTAMLMFAFDACGLVGERRVNATDADSGAEIRDEFSS